MRITHMQLSGKAPKFHAQYTVLALGLRTRELTLPALSSINIVICRAYWKAMFGSGFRVVFGITETVVGIVMCIFLIHVGPFLQMVKNKSPN